MICRCKNPQHSGYRIYGGRGIKVCERWKLFSKFLADMGRRPSDDHSLGRINNEGNYCPENCRWETALQQQNNTRVTRLITFGSQTKSVSEWNRHLGFPHGLLAQRLCTLKWSVEKAITTPKMNRFGL